MRALLMTFALVAACGGGGSKPAAEEPHEPPEHHEMEEEALTPELKDFHDVLAPLWHSEAPTRQADTCGSTPQLADLAGKVQGAGAPEGAAADWNDRAQALVDAVGALGDACQSGEGFDDTFATVHQGFHAMMDALPR